MEDQPADSGDLTTGPADSQDSTPAKRRGGWPFKRRRTAADTSVADVDEVPAEESETPAVRTPVGKSRRTARMPDEPTAAGVTEPAAAEPEPEEPQPEPEPEAQEPEAKPEEPQPEPEPETQEPEAEEAEPGPVLVPHQPAGRRLLIAAAAAAVVFVGAAAFAGATLQPYLSDRAATDTKLDIAQTAADAITTLWTYTPDDMETLPDRASEYLAGDFATQYRTYIDAIVATNKQAQVSNTTQVMGAAVESLTPMEATAIVYTNSMATSPVNKNIPSLRYLSYRLTMEREDARWMITRMNAITQMDLTPQL